jgi:hypothetical protein
MWILALVPMVSDYGVSARTMSQSAQAAVSGPVTPIPTSGTAQAEVRLDGAGHVIGCTITKSSGSAEVDKRSCDVLRKDVESQLRRGTLPVSDEADNSWHADIVDLSDPAHPSCASRSKGNSAGSPGCAAILKRPDLSILGQQARQAVFFISVAQAGDQPYEGDPQWGTRISNAVTNIYTLNGSSECVPVSFEPGHNPCDKFATAHKFSEEERKKARKTTIQETLFALPRRD